MANEPSEHKRNLFEVDNARNLSMQELVETFIPTQSFWRLLSAKHHVLLGTRGHGKTALVKMLSHNHLALLARSGNEPRAESAIHNQEFIGIYVPTRLEWVGGLKNKPWLDEKEREELFQWRLNLACCIAFLPIAESCISNYVNGKANQARAEKDLAHQLSTDWIADNDQLFDDLLQLRHYIEDMDYKKQIQVIRVRAAGCLAPGESPVGIAFSTDLFLPLRHGIKRLSRILSINPNCSWLLCLDEAEFLEEMDHRIINSHMRAFPDNLFFKMTTKPYCHHTLETNTRESLVHGHDFEYVNMTYDNVLTAVTLGEHETVGTRFGRSLFSRILEASDPKIAQTRRKKALSVNEVLGVSEILDPRKEDWGANSKNMTLLETYASNKTIERTHRLIESGNIKSFRDQIGRKIQGVLLLREARENWKGNKAVTAYSGASMAIRCADGNPRRLIRIFNTLLMLRPKEQRRKHRLRITSVISPREQTRAMLSLSASTLNQVRSLPKTGYRLHEFLCMLGSYMHADIHKKPIVTDQVSSIKLDDSVSDEEWELVMEGVDEGFLYPNISAGNPDEMPWREGTFHLTYALAPYFFLLPRRGKYVKLKTIKKFHTIAEKEQYKYISDGPKQLSLFYEKGDA